MKLIAKRSVLLRDNFMLVYPVTIIYTCKRFFTNIFVVFFIVNFLIVMVSRRRPWIERSSGQWRHAVLFRWMPEHEHGRGTGRRQGHIRIVVRTRDPPIRTYTCKRTRVRSHSTHASHGFAKDYPPPYVARLPSVFIVRSRSIGYTRRIWIWYAIFDAENRV